jgi:hypothetical protein
MTIVRMPDRAFSFSDAWRTPPPTHRERNFHTINRRCKNGSLSK